MSQSNDINFQLEKNKKPVLNPKYKKENNKIIAEINELKNF